MDIKVILAIVSLLGLLQQYVMAIEISGYIEGEGRYFFEQGLYSQQKDKSVSIAWQPELYAAWESNGIEKSMTVVPFLRWDNVDNARSHADIREFKTIWAKDDWEWEAGISKIFWGVTEALHLVDVINQTDILESIDGEEKWGQPLLRATKITDWGVWDLLLLPGFRERIFPGKAGRFSTPLVIENEQAKYQSGAKQLHTDWALRWSHNMNDWDIGIAYFEGTRRAPRLTINYNFLQKKAYLIPYYEQMQQWGIDLQYTQGSWLWKGELISQNNPTDDQYTAITGGFEYTWYDVWQTGKDVGVLGEYLFDDRGDNADDLLFAHHWFAGIRVAFNDAQSSEVLAGGIFDSYSAMQMYSVEASRRFLDSWKVSIEARFFSHIDKQTPLYTLAKDDYIELRLAYYFSEQLN